MRTTLRTSGLFLSSALLALLCACGSSSPKGGSTTPSDPPVATAPACAAGASLNEYQAYTFTTTASDPDIGVAVTSCSWNFGDGTNPTVVTTAPFSASHTFTSASSGTPFTVSVTPSVGTLVGKAATSTFTVQAVGNPFTTSVISPSGSTPVPVAKGSTATVTFIFTVTYAGTGTVDLTSTAGIVNSLVFTPGTNGSITSETAGSVDGKTPWSVTAAYTAGANVGDSYSVTPSLTVADSFGVQSVPLVFPAQTFQTVVANPTPPSLVISAPQAASTQIYALQTATVNFSVTDAGTFPTTVTVDWGDANAPAPTLLTLSGGALATGLAPSPAPTHQYTQAGTYTVTVTAVDTQATNNAAPPQTRTFVVLANALPTATITSPQASGSLPANVGLIQAFTPSADNAEMTLPPAVNYPQAVVIPLNGELNFNGSDTLTTSGEPLALVQWTFPGGNPGTSNALNAGSVSFAGVPGQIVAYLVELQVTDVFGRTSSQIGTGLTGPAASAPAGNNTTPFRKWVIVDGTQTQNFNLNFLYRQKTDNLQAPIALAPVISAANGLGANVEIFQDGVSNFFTVQSSNQASVIIPVRSNLPFWINIPSFGTDSLGYVMEIPNAPTGLYADPTLVTAPTLPAVPTEGFFFASASTPYNPTLNLVTGQGYATEGATPAAVEYQGWVSTPPMGGTASGGPQTDRWFNFLGIPTTDSNSTQWVQPSNLIYSFAGINAYQSFPEWVVALKTLEPDKLPGDTVLDTYSSSAGQPTDLGFTLKRAAYTVDDATSKTFAAVAMEAFRVPAGEADPYNLSTGPANWNAASCSTLTQPLEIATFANAVQTPIGALYDTMLYNGPGTSGLTGGLNGLVIPYDPNDPNRTVLTPTSTPPSTIRNLGITRKVFAQSEYIWSSVWVRPLNLNTANLAYTDDPGAFNFFRYSSQTAWPSYTTAPGITPDHSTFDLTVNNGGTFDAGSPVSTTGAPDSKSVGRFWWTAYTPQYNASSGGCIARTWLADPGSSLLPLTQTPAATDANNILGLLPPVDPVVDKRLRDANGNVVSPVTTGGFRILWFNPTKEADQATCVHPDFWAVELTATNASGTTTNHFLLPASFPAAPALPATDNTQSTAAQILTDARHYLPSGNAPAVGPNAGDTVAPGYCWFDVPVELRPTSGTATITIFALKSILANNPTPGANPRALSRTDWIDAIKTVTATITIDSGAGKDLGYVYKVPFNFGWDIVVANCEATIVAP